MIKDHFEPLSVHFYVTARRLNEYIRHYEPLSYPTEEVHRGHLRAKRSVTRDNSVTLKFRSHGRDFHIRLKRDLATFSNNLIIEGPSGQTEDLDTSHIYQGHLVGKFNHHFLSSFALRSELYVRNNCTLENILIKVRLYYTTFWQESFHIFFHFHCLETVVPQQDDTLSFLFLKFNENNIYNNVTKA